MSDRPRTAPRRRIIKTAGIGRRTRRGITMTAVLECGHLTDCNARDRKRGDLHCFDCLFGKPADPMGAVVVKEHREAGTLPGPAIRTRSIGDGAVQVLSLADDRIMGYVHRVGRRWFSRVTVYAYGEPRRSLAIGPREGFATQREAVAEVFIEQNF